MEGVNTPTTWLTKFTVSWMDENLDAVLLVAIQWPKKSSEKMENQKEDKPNENELSSEGEDGIKILQGRNHDRKTHWKYLGVTLTFTYMNHRDCFLAYHIDR